MIQYLYNWTCSYHSVSDEILVLSSDPSIHQGGIKWIGQNLIFVIEYDIALHYTCTKWSEYNSHVKTSTFVPILFLVICQPNLVFLFSLSKPYTTFFIYPSKILVKTIAFVSHFFG